MPGFAAIDFETADRQRDSACAVGAVLVEKGRLTDRYYRLIRPPRKRFEFTYVHGLTWTDVRDSPTFGEVWPELCDFMDGAQFLVAHNAPFDRGVLHRCCEEANVVPPTHEFRCTMQMALTRLNLPSGKLSEVCHRLGIPLDHHNALSDGHCQSKPAPA